MMSIVNFIFSFLLLTDVSGYINSFGNRIIRNNKLCASSYNNDYFKYDNEYYNFLVDYDLLESKYNNLLLSSGDNSILYNSIINDRIDKYLIFESNYDKIMKFNSDPNNFKLGLNQFADTYEIFNENNIMKDKIKKNEIIKNNLMSVKQLIENPNYYIDKYNNISSEFVWNSTYISNVKNQGRCGSCWAFSSTSAIEAMMRINNFPVDRLSEQELVDCSIENNGCNGGLMHIAFDYCIDNNGLTSNNVYNYTANDGSCKINYNNTDIVMFKKIKGSNIKSYKFTIPRSVLDIKASLKTGPISIALDASPFEFRFYKEGIIDIASKNTSSINHAVLLTGYKEYENGTYWIIQNSWGESWGENGYAKIKITNGDGILLSQIYGVYPYI